MNARYIVFMVFITFMLFAPSLSIGIVKASQYGTRTSVPDSIKTGETVELKVGVFIFDDNDPTKIINPVSGATVSVTVDGGAITPSTAYTDEAGWAYFQYTAPAHRGDYKISYRTNYGANTPLVLMGWSVLHVYEAGDGGTTAPTWWQQIMDALRAIWASILRLFGLGW